MHVGQTPRVGAPDDAYHRLCGQIRGLFKTGGSCNLLIGECIQNRGLRITNALNAKIACVVLALSSNGRLGNIMNA